MKNFFCLLWLFLPAVPAGAQEVTTVPSSWDRIVLVEHDFPDSYYKNVWVVKKEDLLLRHEGHKDSIIKKIDPALVDALFAAHAVKTITKDPLNYFGLDSTWLIQNARKLWLNYLGKKDEPATVDSMAVETIRNYAKVKEVVEMVRHRFWSSYCPFSNVYIIHGNDTTKIYYREIIENSALSSVLLQWSPDTSAQRREKADREKLGIIVVDKIYTLLVERKANEWKLMQQYRGKFRRLGKRFQVESAKLIAMSSIEWESDRFFYCMELALRDSAVAENIQFSAIFGKPFFVHSFRPLIRKKKKMLVRLENNPVYKYTLGCTDCLGEIHFVNRRSMSRKARGNFMEDAEKRGMDARLFKGKLKRAIFYEITETEKQGCCTTITSHSRWVFLKDGTIVLWKEGTHGEAVLPEVIRKQGYVVRVVE